jgi:hypothetical protein
MGMTLGSNPQLAAAPTTQASQVATPRPATPAQAPAPAAAQPPAASTAQPAATALAGNSPSGVSAPAAGTAVTQAQGKAAQSATGQVTQNVAAVADHVNTVTSGADTGSQLAGAAARYLPGSIGAAAGTAGEFAANLGRRAPGVGLVTSGAELANQAANGNLSASNPDTWASGLNGLAAGCALAGQPECAIPAGIAGAAISNRGAIDSALHSIPQLPPSPGYDPNSPFLLTGP